MTRVRTPVWVVASILVAGTLVYVDVSWRARHAYLEGEKFWRWADHPEEHAQVLEQEFRAKKEALERRFAKGVLSQRDYERELDLLRFWKTLSLEESTIKYAYVWYRTAVDLCSPPESNWVRLARQKLPMARERWEQELREKTGSFKTPVPE
jgi:hypothetical protein